MEFQENKRKTVVINRPRTAIMRKNTDEELATDYAAIFNLTPEEQELIGFQK